MEMSINFRTDFNFFFNISRLKVKRTFPGPKSIDTRATNSIDFLVIQISPEIPKRYHWNGNFVSFFFLTVIEVCSREYGDYSEKMATSVDNGKCLRWYKDKSETRKPIVRKASQYDTVSHHLYDFSSSGWSQFNVLLRRILIQHKRNYVSDINNTIPRLSTPKN